MLKSHGVTDRKLDKRLALEVMGWELQSFLDPQIFNTGNYEVNFRPSTELRYAFQVVEKMESNGYLYSISNIVSNGEFNVQVGFCLIGEDRWYTHTTKFLAEAICESALLAISTNATLNKVIL
jgi:hypothetical protein